MATKAQLEASRRHQEKLDRGVFYLPAGTLDKVKQHAKSKGMSLNAYINYLIEADMKESQ